DLAPPAPAAVATGGAQVEALVPLAPAPAREPRPFGANAPPVFDVLALEIPAQGIALDVVAVGVGGHEALGADGRSGLGRRRKRSGQAQGQQRASETAHFVPQVLRVWSSSAA